MKREHYEGMFGGVIGWELGGWLWPAVNAQFGALGGFVLFVGLCLGFYGISVRPWLKGRQR